MLVAGLLIIAYRIPYGGRNKGKLVRRVKSYIYITKRPPTRLYLPTAQAKERVEYDSDIG